MDNSTFADAFGDDLNDEFFIEGDIVDDEEDIHSLPSTSLKPTGSNRWDPRLILDLAIGLDDLDEVLNRYGLTEEEYNLLSDTPLFKRELALTMRDIRDKGVSFSKKASVQAESYLEILDELVYNEDKTVPANIRLEAIRSAVKWGRLEPPKESGEGGGQTATQVNVQINF